MLLSLVGSVEHPRKCTSRIEYSYSKLQETLSKTAKDFRIA